MLGIMPTPVNLFPIELDRPLPCPSTRLGYSRGKHNFDSGLRRSNDWYEKTKEGADFLKLAEPIKIGHHSEGRHRALIDRNWKRMGKSVEFSDKARKLQSKIDYWKRRENEITLAMPESLEFYTFKLEEATRLNQGLKNGTIEREHDYSSVYANKAVKKLTKKLEIAQKLWA